MEELIYNLQTIMNMRKAVSQIYNSIKDSQKYIECISIIDVIEERMIQEINELYNKSIQRSM